MVDVRFISACVGNSTSTAPAPCETAVHPRVCGELALGGAPCVRVSGSSPRVWGTQSLVQGIDVRFRFIPACVGNSRIPSRKAALPTVHPRVCGELVEQAVGLCEGAGSSPRVWGTRQTYCECTFAIRFIPACVGNSAPASRGVRGSPVHPRVCGELMTDTLKSAVYAGSSPRVWGTRHSHWHAGRAHRFIPACVGNSPPMQTRMTCISVHPRVCGELLDRPGLPGSQIGSSPRVWGTRQPGQCGRSR